MSILQTLVSGARRICVIWKFLAVGTRDVERKPPFVPGDFN
jgi:hypothetical protein